MPDPEFTIQGLESKHWVRSVTGDNHVAYLLTGVVLLTVQGKGSSWFREKISFDVPIPELRASNALRLVHWAPFVPLNSIANDHTAENAGWAVDNFGLSNAGEDQRGSTSVFANLAVRDSDGFILRLGYVVNLLGDEVPAWR
jgi:hypothetical protein